MDDTCSGLHTMGAADENPTKSSSAHASIIAESTDGKVQDHPPVSNPDPTEDTPAGAFESLPFATEDLPTEWTKSSMSRAQRQMKSRLELPQWFLSAQVKTLKELEAANIPLTVTDVPGSSSPSQNTPASNTIPKYEVSAAMYEPLQHLLLSNSKSRASKDSKNRNKFFHHDAVHLQVPGPSGKKRAGGLHFLLVIVQHFAREIRADLVTIQTGDLLDILLFLGGHAKWETFPNKVHLAAALLASATDKEGIDRATPGRKPLVIHFPRVHKLKEGDRAFWEKLRLLNKFALLIATDDDGEGSDLKSYYVPSSTKGLGRNVRKDPILISPVRTPSQVVLFEQEKENARSFEFQSVRMIQRYIRGLSPKHRNIPLAQPAIHRVDFSARHSNARATCQRRRESGRIKEILLQLGFRSRALEDWINGGTGLPGKWDHLPKAAQNAIQEFQRNAANYEWENMFLDSVIGPENLGQGWSGIALDDEIRDLVDRLLKQPSHTDVASYGILKSNRIGGCLLYGPPGTGKTHLARVIAKESNMAMVNVSASDIEQKYVGETEKAIRGLFSLARKLTPCLIFIDEADSILRQRRPSDRSWVRSRVNGMLAEMDGLKTSKKEPFVVLATNTPQELDEAVLRRCPSRIYVGLPTLEARAQIFRINLEGETLDADVDIDELAARSANYSGSDIKSVCVQAALACDSFTGEDLTRRLLKLEHFDKGFQRHALTVSKSFLAGLREFASEFDPSAVKRMRRFEQLEGSTMASSAIKAGRERR